MSFSIDFFSFLVGFVSASVLWWLIGKARPLWAELMENLRTQREENQTRRTSGMEENHRRLTLRRAQGMHLAAPLFALDEILQEPLLMAPPPLVDPGSPPPAEDVVIQTLPYLPTWPELAAIFHAPTLTLPQALEGGRNLVLTGLPGTGKTVALAYLASLAANRDPKLGILSEYIPFLIHVADLRLPVSNPQDALNPIIAVCDSTTPVFDLPRVPGFVEQAFRSKRALLLLDGFDEMTADGQAAVVEYLKLLLHAHPQARIVTTGSFETLGGLIGLGFASLAMMTWSPQRSQTFINCWGELWGRYVSMEAWAQAQAEQVDPLLINSWLGFGNNPLSPFELTLKVWGAYAGDSRGPRVHDAITSHIRRLAPANTPPAALETLALQVILNGQPIFDPRKARQWVSNFEVPEEVALPGDGLLERSDAEELEQEENAKGKDRKAQKSAQPPAPAFGLLSQMSSSGLLSQHLNNRMRFVHPLFAGFLAGRALSDEKASSEAVVNQPDWIGKTTTLNYFAAHADVSRLVDKMIEWSRLPMHRPLLAAARWLKDAPREAPWRGKLLAALVKVLRTDGLPNSLRGQIIAALVLSNDPGAAPLFRQFMGLTSYELVQLCALGSGAMQDQKSVHALEDLLHAPNLTARQAACLALVAIGTTPSLEVVAQTLLGADESLRKAAAEALANDPGEGYAMLKEGVTLEDILLRRAVVYGLGRVDEPWARELLMTVQIQDKEWVVRNSATEVLDYHKRIGASIPRRLTPPSETPWLIEFAGRQGIGISPGAPATDILLTGLKDTNPDVRLSSLQYLKQNPTEGVITQLYHSMYKDDPHLREAAYHALMEIAASGVRLPHPSQFGIE
jgi:HEAT repeat protein